MLKGRPTVPEHAKKENGGPYVQAPPEWGGEWWIVNPFYSEKPWERLWRGGVGAEVIPPGFIEVFGERPRTPQELSRWKDDLKFFKSAGPPEWISQEELDNIASTTKAWGMGEPKYYEGRYGFQARFPGSGITFEFPARGLQTSVHLAVAAFQMRMIEEGIMPDKKHPFTPPEYFGE